MTTAKKEFDKVFPNNELEKRIMDAFEVFDHSAKQVVDVREIGTILRSLGCCPTEAEVQEVILATENKEATGNVPLAYFLPYLSKAMVEHRFYPASAEVLLAAFRYFDEEGRGYITKERFTQLMLEEGEPFTQEEFDEMIQTALDPVTDTITYEYYINQLMVAQSDVYAVADKVEAERKKVLAAQPKRRRASSLLRVAAATSANAMPTQWKTKSWRIKSRQNKFQFIFNDNPEYSTKYSKKVKIKPSVI